jgi:hypothetical protein
MILLLHAFRHAHTVTRLATSYVVSVDALRPYVVRLGLIVHVRFVCLILPLDIRYYRLCDLLHVDVCLPA